MLLFTGRKHHHLHIEEEEKREDTGTCLNCQNQGTGNKICQECIRNQYNRKKAITGDYFTLID